jgi:hypothetical protein
MIYIIVLLSCNIYRIKNQIKRGTKRLKAIQIKPDIYWVGAIDWAVRDFHGYVTPKGTTYNNYLIIDDKITLPSWIQSNILFQKLLLITSRV